MALFRNNDPAASRGPLPIVILIVILAIGIIVFAATRSTNFDDTDAVLKRFQKVGDAWWAPLLYAGTYALLSVLFIPPHPLSVAAVVVWGWQLGGIIELISATLSSIAPYLIARSTGRRWIEERLSSRRQIAETLSREGSVLLLVLRLTAIVPYTLLNFLAGLTSISLLRYLMTTFAGMIPSVFIFAYFVDALLQGVLRPGEVLARVVIAGGLLAALVLAGRIVGRRLRKRTD